MEDRNPPERPIFAKFRSVPRTGKRTRACGECIFCSKRISRDAREMYKHLIACHKNVLSPDELRELSEDRDAHRRPSSRSHALDLDSSSDTSRLLGSDPTVRDISIGQTPSAFLGVDMSIDQHLPPQPPPLPYRVPTPPLQPRLEIFPCALPRTPQSPPLELPQIIPRESSFLGSQSHFERRDQPVSVFGALCQHPLSLLAAAVLATKTPVEMANSPVFADFMVRLGRDSSFVESCTRLLAQGGHLPPLVADSGTAAMSVVEALIAELERQRNIVLVVDDAGIGMPLQQRTVGAGEVQLCAAVHAVPLCSPLGHYYLGHVPVARVHGSGVAPLGDFAALRSLVAQFSSGSRVPFIISGQGTSISALSRPDLDWTQAFVVPDLGASLAAAFAVLYQRPEVQARVRSVRDVAPQLFSPAAVSALDPGPHCALTQGSVGLLAAQVEAANVLIRSLSPSGAPVQIDSTVICNTQTCALVCALSMLRDCVEQLGVCSYMALEKVARTSLAFSQREGLLRELPHEVPGEIAGILDGAVAVYTAPLHGQLTLAGVLAAGGGYPNGRFSGSQDHIFSALQAFLGLADGTIQIEEQLRMMRQLVA